MRKYYININYIININIKLQHKETFSFKITLALVIGSAHLIEHRFSWL